MNKKQLRKNLELELVKTIEGLLISINPEAALKVNDLIFGASKIIAKKFYKTAKPKEEKEPKPVKKKVEKKVTKTAPKKPTKPAVSKTKSKK